MVAGYRRHCLLMRWLREVGPCEQETRSSLREARSFGAESSFRRIDGSRFRAENEEHDRRATKSTLGHRPNVGEMTNMRWVSPLLETDGAVAGSTRSPPVANGDGTNSSQ